MKTFIQTFFTPKRSVAKGYHFLALFGAFAVGAFSFIALNGGSISPIAVAHAIPFGSCSDNVISGSVNKPTPSVGDTIVYTFTTNTLGGAGVQASTTIVLANDTMPSGLTFVSSSTSGGPFSGTWSGGVVTITITATVDATGTISYAPTFAYNGNDCAAESMTNPGPVVINVSSPSADLSIAKTVTPTSTTAGNKVDYTIAVTNLSATTTATGVVASDTLPSGLTFGSATTTVGTSTYASSTDTETWTIGALAPSATVTLDITALVDSDASSTVWNTATVSASTTDPDVTNNSSSISIDVQSTSTPTSTVAAAINFGGIEDASNTYEKNGDYNDVVFSFSTSSAVTAVSRNGALDPLTTNLVNESGTIYWGNPSLDGSEMNIGYCVLGNGNCPPIGGPFSNVQYYAGANGVQPDDVLLNASGSVTMTLLAKITSLNNVDSVGWYDPTAPSILHTIFAGSAATGTSATFTPSAVFGLYLSNGSYQSMSQNENDTNNAIQKFALFDVTFPTPTSTPTSTPSADLSINKTVDKSNPSAGDTVNYTITVTNDSTSTTSTNVVASDTLPSTLTFENATTTVGTSTFATSTDAGTWTFGNLLPNATATLQIAALVNSGDAGDTITNTATVSASTTDPDMSNNSSSISIDVQGGGCGSACSLPDVDLAISKIADVTSTFAGDPINYTIVVTNLSSSTASTDVVATDTLPSGLTFENATASASTSYASSTGTWTIGALAPNATATLQIATLVTGPGVSTGGSTNSTITNTATVGESPTLNDPDMSNNSSSVPVLIGPALPPTGPDLTISKTVDNANPTAGDDVNYTILVTNSGSATSTFVEVQDALPLSLSVVSSTISQGSSTNAGVFDWNNITLAPNATATLVLNAAVGGNQAGQSITNTATVFSQSDPSLVASSSVTINVQGGGGGCITNCGGGGNIPSAEIGIVKTVDNADPATGSTIHYTLTVNATGPSASFGVAAKDVLPAGLTFVSASSSEGSYASSTGVWTIGTIAAGQDATLVITATVTAPDDTKITNTATVSESPTVIDPLSGNNSSSVTVDVGGKVLGVSTSTVATSTGQVLGASCGLYLTSYIHPNRQGLNDPAQVKKLQTFLNQNLGLDLPITGYYGSSTIAAVDQFQVKYHTEVLHPWTSLGLPTDFTPTSYVYQTTQRWINLIMCPSLNLPVPALKVDNSE